MMTAQNGRRFRMRRQPNGTPGRSSASGRLLGTVEAPDRTGAIEKAVQEFKTVAPVRRAAAMTRRKGEISAADAKPRRAVKKDST